MADVITTTKTLTIVAEFTDGDNRSISIDNPRDEITWTNIQTLSQKATNVLIGDKTNAPFTRISSARITNRRTYTIDPEQI